MPADPPLEPGKKSRVRIFGRAQTNAEVANHCRAELEHAKTTRAALAASLSISRVTLNKYLELAARLERVPEHTKLLREEGPGKIPETDEAFRTHPLIVAWIENMGRRGTADHPFRGTQKYVRNFYATCKTLNVAPQYWLMGGTIPEVLEHARRGMAEFMKLYAEGKSIVRRPKLKLGPAAARAYAMPVRDFMRINGYTFPKGEGGVMSLSIATLHGKYSTLKITDEQHEKIRAALKAKYGRGSPEWLWYMLGMETFARQKALAQIKTDFEILNIKGKEVLITTVIERKTAQYKGGKWTKHVFDPELIEVMKEVAKTGRTYVFADQSHGAIQALNAALRAQYRAVGLDREGRADPDDPDSSYFIQRPTHALRHAGVQRLLHRSNWNVAYVAQRGWKTPLELTMSYGDMPAEYQLNLLEDMV